MQKISRKNTVLLGLGGVAVLAAVILGRAFFKAPTEKSKNTPSLKPVKAVELRTVSAQDGINVQGTVKAVNKVDVVALANGTVKQFDLKVGDQVFMNQPLAGLYDAVLMTNLLNANINANNVAQNYQNTGKVSDEAVKQSQLSLSRAQESLVGAEVGLKSAKDSFENAKSLIEKNRIDIKSNAVVAYANYLNTINSYLDQADYIIKAEGSEQLAGISLTLAAKNSQSLADAKADYLIVRNRYDALANKTPTIETAAASIGEVVTNLKEAKKLADDMVEVLSSTVPHSQFSEAALSAQKASFTGLRSMIINTQAAAQATLQSLENFELSSKQQLDGTANAVKAAESQLAQAHLALDSARAGLSGSEKSKQQQLDLTRTSLDNAQGQYQLLSEQASDLTIRAPIDGELTGKMIEVGTEVRIGQRIAEISKVDSVKIVASLSPEDAGRIRLGQEVTINGKFKGIINLINPTADVANKKIQVEAVYDNQDKALIAETLVDLTIPLKPAGPSGSGVYRLPLKVLTISQNENYIFVVDQGKAKKVNVTLDRIEGESAYVRTDLPGNAMIIVDGNKLLEDGELIILEK